MNINIYSSYKVKILTESNRLSEENITIYDNIFVKEKYENVKILDGGKLLEMIANNLNETYFSSLILSEKIIRFEYFNYNNGESWNIIYELL